MKSLLRWLFLDRSTWYRVQWPTRAPRPRVFDDGEKSIAQLLREIR